MSFALYGRSIPRQRSEAQSRSISSTLGGLGIILLLDMEAVKVSGVCDATLPSTARI